jgi:hypothetical protein
MEGLSPIALNGTSVPEGERSVEVAGISSAIKVRRGEQYPK